MGPVTGIGYPMSGSDKRIVSNPLKNGDIDWPVTQFSSNVSLTRNEDDALPPYRAV